MTVGNYRSESDLIKRALDFPFLELCPTATISFSSCEIEIAKHSV
jgi:hypothetical protein